MKKLLFYTLLLFSVAGYSQQNQAVISVTGEGIVNVVPDNVVIRARIEHTGKSAAEVKKQNDQVVNQVIQYLKSQGIPSKNFQTQYINLNKDYNYNSKETFYSANQSISIKLEDLSKYEKLMSGLLESGLNRIDGIQFQSSRQDELETEARKRAILDALQKAKEYAGALGQEVGKAQSINELDGGNFPPMYRMEMKVQDSSEQQTIAPGEMQITVKVNATFLLI